MLLGLTPQSPSRAFEAWMQQGGVVRQSRFRSQRKGGDLGEDVVDRYAREAERRQGSEGALFLFCFRAGDRTFAHALPDSRAGRLRWRAGRRLAGSFRENRMNRSFHRDDLTGPRLRDWLLAFPPGLALESFAQLVGRSLDTFL